MLPWKLVTDIVRGVQQIRFPGNIFNHSALASAEFSKGALKTQVRKRQVRNSAFRKGGKRMYGKGKYESAGMENASTENASTMQIFSHKKNLVLHKLVWRIFKWGGQVDYRLFFLR